jgi:hypothetical protein
MSFLLEGEKLEGEAADEAEDSEKYEDVNLTERLFDILLSTSSSFSCSSSLSGRTVVASFMASVVIIADGGVSVITLLSLLSLLIIYLFHFPTQSKQYMPCRFLLVYCDNIIHHTSSFDSQRLIFLSKKQVLEASES